jgi:fumarate reductase subunit D
MARDRTEPLFWLLFSAGGVVSAMLIPSLLFLFGMAFPLGWMAPPTHEHMSQVLGNFIVRLVLLGLIVLSLFHWAHRFRHTMNDGLQIKHLDPMMILVCYGLAVVGSVAAVLLLWQAV